MPRYKQVHDGEWVQPIRHGYKMMCCDCGLVHKIDFRLLPFGRGKKIQFRAGRLTRATANARRAKQKIRIER